MSGHTPGPWHIFKPYMNCVRATDTTVIANTDNARQYENARLIAAAPDLLESLKTTLRMLEAAHRELGMYSPGDKRIRAAREAISKATGELP